MKEVKYDTPIPVTKWQYDDIMHKCSGSVAGRRDENGQYWIKVWNFGYDNWVKLKIEGMINND